MSLAWESLGLEGKQEEGEEAEKEEEGDQDGKEVFSETCMTSGRKGSERKEKQLPSKRTRRQVA